MAHKLDAKKERATSKSRVCLESQIESVFALYGKYTDQMVKYFIKIEHNKQSFCT